MATGPGHYRLAEQLLAEVEAVNQFNAYTNGQLAAAQVHATLALAAAAAIGNGDGQPSPSVWNEWWDAAAPKGDAS